MSGSVNSSEFEICVQLERLTVERLTAVLQQEQQALVDNDIGRVESSASAKTALLKQLAGIANKRNHHLALLGLQPGREGMETWIANSAPPKTAANWRESLRLAEAVRQLNQTNGVMISARLNHNQEALAALLGAANAASLYGPYGQTLHAGGGRQLATA